MKLLARREHASQEILQKLKTRGHDPAAVAPVLEDLQRRGLQSDRRFTEAYIRSRAERGYGPQRIINELRQRGVAEDLIGAGMDACEVDWQDLLATVRHKKFGVARPGNYPEIMKQSAFLQYRGFTNDQIRKYFRQDSDDGQ